MAKTYISVGSNIGDRLENCRKAVSAVADLAKVTAVSSVYETEPVGPKDQPDFINCAVEIETDLPPRKLLAELLSIEDALGRVRKERWRERAVDLDIIFYGNLVMHSDDLTIPHPRAHLRRFVLEPVSEINPGFVHPVLGASVSEILQEMEETEKVTKSAPPTELYPQ